MNSDLDDLTNTGPVYAVAIGNKPGLYSSWAECQAATKGAQYAVYQKCPNALAAIEWLEESVHKEDRIPNAVSIYIARRKNCIVLWYPNTPTATKVFRCKDLNVDLRLLALKFALEHTAMHDVNLVYSDSATVKGFNYFLKGWMQQNQASPLWQQIHQLASRRQQRLTLKYLPKSSPEMNYAMYVAELYWRDK
jgi:hypothetical protein